MKVSKNRVRQIIKEELENVLMEQAPVRDIPTPVDLSTPQGIWADFKKQNLLDRRNGMEKPTSFMDLVEWNLIPAVQYAQATWGTFAAINLGLSLPKKTADAKPELDPKKFRCFSGKMKREPEIKNLQKRLKNLSSLRDDKRAQKWLSVNYEGLVGSLKACGPRSDMMQLSLFKKAEAHASACGGGSGGGDDL